MEENVFELGQKLWNYHLLNHKLTESDLILVLGNSDINTIYQGINLYNKKLAPKILISGGLGKVTSTLWKESEAERFAKIAIQEGIPEENIILESNSSNTGENYQFSKRILLEKNIPFQKTIIITKPYMERRAFSTAKVHWADVDIAISSISLSFKEYVEKIGDFDFIMNLMVGDLQRIEEYPKMGFQIYQEIPPEIRKVYEDLVKLGYTKNLLK